MGPYIYPLHWVVAPRGDDGRELQLGLETSLFIAHLGHFHFHSFLLLSFLFFFVFFHSCRFHAQVFGRTLMHEFHVFYSHTEWNLLSSLFWIDFVLVGIVLSKLNTMKILMFTYL